MIILWIVTFLSVLTVDPIFCCPPVNQKPTAGETINLQRPGGQGKIPPGAINNDACNGVSVRCDSRSPYRTINGVCNNLQNPYLGASNSIMRRFLDSEYNDCTNEPKGGFSNSEERFLQHYNYSRKGYYTSSRCSRTLPNAREVSTTFHPDLDIPENYFSLMVMQFGQFLDHDLALTPEVEVEDCCEHPQTEDCFPIFIPRKDTFYSSREIPQTCQEFTRSDAFCDSGSSSSNRKKKPQGGNNFQGGNSNRREQYSIVTAFVDGSQIYGSDDELATKLRAGSGGRLSVNTDYSKEILPEIDGELLSGDIRALDMPGLASVHTLFLREHNRVADLFRSNSFGFNDEEIYQKSREIVIAELQNIVYGEYLPLILGQTAIDKYGLNIPSMGFTHYNKEQDPSIVNSFTTAAFRFGHSLIQGLVNMADLNNPNSVTQYQLRENFFNMDRYLSNDGLGMEQIIAGIVGQEAQTMDRFVTEDVTNFLFLKFGEDTGNIGTRDFGGDLVARNIQRGRDHGIPGYNSYRGFCGLKSIHSMKRRHRPKEISSKNWKILGELYRTPNDIDLFVGGLAEVAVKDGLTGPTFNCIKSIQFKSLKDGDRFFFTHSNQAGSFNQQQLEQLKKRTLRDIICQNTGIARMRSNAFLLTGSSFPCTDVNELDVRHFLTRGTGGVSFSRPNAEVSFP